ncbi:MAG: hypothetical protein RL326_1431 [Pseudomonadota bacterium]|jgi:hypothetical protein
MDAILISKDLLFITKVKEAAMTAGARLMVVKSTEALEGALVSSPSGGVVMIDLEKCPMPLDMIRSALPQAGESRWRVCSFFSHVHLETADHARQLALGDVMPRSKFVSILPNLLSSLG